MAQPSQNHILEVWGDFACFSRPEMAVERYSYPCPSPSAARGIFEAIYFKPQFYWQITKIEILTHPSYIALRRNEVKDKISELAVKKWMAGSDDVTPLYADADKSVVGTDQKGRTQRQTMAIRNPHYRLHASIIPRRGNEAQHSAYDNQFVRRASQGKCFQQPYMGCKEFVCFFNYVSDMTDQRQPCDFTQDLGFMLYDVFDLGQDNHEAFRKNWKSVQPSVSMFRVRVESGVLDVPAFDSPKVLKPTGV